MIATLPAHWRVVLPEFYAEFDALETEHLRLDRLLARADCAAQEMLEAKSRTAARAMDECFDRVHRAIAASPARSSADVAAKLKLARKLARDGDELVDVVLRGAIADLGRISKAVAA